MTTMRMTSERLGSSLQEAGCRTASDSPASCPLPPAFCSPPTAFSLHIPACFAAMSSRAALQP
jgi:hypothetical protein